MQEDIIYKLKTLQSIEPEEAWQADRKRKLMEKISVFGVKNDIFLSSGDIYSEKPRFSFRNLMPSRLAVSFTSFAIILTSSILTVGASQSSLPGDALYPVKKVGEQVKLAMTSEENKPKVEIEQAGKRLEELAKVSQNTSDSEQHNKVEALVAEFQAKVDSANAHLGELSEKGSNSVQVAAVAKVVNAQSEKYSEALQKTTQSLPEVVKEKVAVQVADATKTTEKTNLSALLVMVETDDDTNSEEIAALVQKTVEKAEVKLTELSAQTSSAVVTQAACSADDIKNDVAISDSVCASKDLSAGNVVIAEEAQKELDKAKENLNNNNLVDTVKSVAAVTEITATIGTASNTVQIGTVAGAYTATPANTVAPQ